MNAVRRMLLIALSLFLVSGVSAGSLNGKTDLSRRSPGGLILQKSITRLRQRTKKRRRTTKHSLLRTAGEPWSVNDWLFLMDGTWYGLDYFIIKVLFPAYLAHPEVSSYLPAFNGFTWEKWDGWSRTVVTDGADSSYAAYDTKGRLTEADDSYYYQTILKYDNADRLSEVHLIDHEIDTMIITEKYKINYANGKPLELIEEYWINEQQLEEKYKMSLSYNSDNNLIGAVDSLWDETSGTWGQGEIKEVVTYTAGGNIQEDTYYEWDEDAGSWINDSKTTFTYNGNGYMVEEVAKVDFEGAGVWENAFKYTYGYDASGNWTEYKSFTWDEDNAVWGACELKYATSYNANGSMTEDIFYLLDETSGDLVESERYTYSYNSSGNFSDEFWYVWVAGDWEPDDKFEYTYDTNGKPDMMTSYYYNAATDEWVLDGEFPVTFVYDNGIKHNSCTFLKKNGLQVTFKSTLRFLSVAVQGPPDNNAHCTVYDLQGRVLADIQPTVNGNTTGYTWNYTDKTGKAVANQVYVCCIRHHNRSVPIRIFP